MTIDEWLKKSVALLGSVDIQTARLDAEVLLADELGKDRSWLQAHGDFKLASKQVHELDKKVATRAKHEPLAYIRGKQEFYGREFAVSPDTLTPRPETEAMVEMVLGLLKNNEITSVADIGAGSGCIIISLQLESNGKAIFKGYEISEKALEIASKNAAKLNAEVAFIQTDILEEDNDWQHAELVVANLPYVPTDFNINLAASHEPSFAIFGGKDGLEYYRAMFNKLSHNTRFVLTESMPPQHLELEVIAKRAGFSLIKTQDFIQQFERK